jgi:hypothetical protein
MTIDSFVQIAALIVAIYALVSRARQLELRIRIGVLESIVAIIYILAIIYLLFYDTFLKIGWAPQWLLQDTLDITPATATFPITILFLLFFLWRFQRRTIPRKSIFRFQELAEELLQRGEYPELISLIDRYWESLLRIYFGPSLLYRFKNRLEKLVVILSPEKDLERLLGHLTRDQLETLAEISKDLLKGNTKVKKKNRKAPQALRLRDALRKIARGFIQWLIKVLPDYQNYSEAAGNLIRAITTNKSFIESASRIRPYFVIRLLENRYFPQWADLLDLYLKSLLRNPQSVLYYEVANIQRSSRKRDKELPKSNRILYFLLNDAKEAEKMSVWKPIGDEVLHFLEERSVFPEEDSYNYSINDFGGTDPEIEQSPVHLGIQFFDIMVTRALDQGVEWHMWLYYFPHFVKKIIQNYKPHSRVDLSREYPTRYSKFLYDIIDVYHGWIKAAKDLVPKKQSNVVLANTNAVHENNNIPKSSIIALGLSLEDILFAENLSERYKRYLMDIVFEFYFELRKDVITEEYGKVYFAMLKGKGIFDKEEFCNAVMNYFHQFDKVTYQIWSPELVQEFLESK